MTRQEFEDIDDWESLLLVASDFADYDDVSDIYNSDDAWDFFNESRMDVMENYDWVDGTDILMEARNTIEGWGGEGWFQIDGYEIYEAGDDLFDDKKDAIRDYMEQGELFEDDESNDTSDDEDENDDAEEEDIPHFETPKCTEFFGFMVSSD